MRSPSSSVPSRAGPPSPGQYTSVQVALSALDRLEVRGRDSAGIHLPVRDHDLDLESPAIAAQLVARSSDPLFSSTSVRAAGKALSFVYKAAAEIGELGDNTRSSAWTSAATRSSRRRSRGADPGRRARPHPVGERRNHLPAQRAPAQRGGADRVDGPYVAAALNGDVDNFADLKTSERVAHRAGDHDRREGQPHARMRRLASGSGLDDAFRRTVAQLEGSVGIAASAADAPADLLLAQGQRPGPLHPGLADGLTLVASEPRPGGGVRELPPSTARRRPTSATRWDRAGRKSGSPMRRQAPYGITRWSYDGRTLPIRPRSCTRGSHYPGHRRGGSPALPAQGDHRVNGASARRSGGKLVDWTVGSPWPSAPRRAGRRHL